MIKGWFPLLKGVSKAYSLTVNGMDKVEAPNQFTDLVG